VGSRLPFARPAIADTSTARRRVAADATNKLLKAGSIIATISGRIARVGA
jgi:hypothetical protein